MTASFHRSLGVALALASLLALWPGTGRAHDASSWGGLFRSRNAGATWFQASVGKVMGGALAIAMHPNDPNLLLLGTDSGLLESHNGGLEWDLVGGDVLAGPVLAVAFDAVGHAQLAASGSALAASDDGVHWQPAAPPPVGAAPARGLIAGAAADAFYLVGWHGLFRTDDAGKTWSQLDGGLPDSTITRLLVNSQTLVVVDSGDVWMSRDNGRRWESQRAGLPSGQIQTVALDPDQADGLWAAGANQVFASADFGSTWRRIGRPLPDADTEMRGIVVDARDHAHIVVSTHRGLYATTDGANTWELLGGNLPGHIEAGPLVRDQTASATLYAGFSVTPYDEAWRNAVAGGSPLARLAASEVLGATALVVLVGLAAGLALHWLAHRQRSGFAGTRELVR